MKTMLTILLAILATQAQEDTLYQFESFLVHACQVRADREPCELQALRRAYAELAKAGPDIIDLVVKGSESRSVITLRGERYSADTAVARIIAGKLHYLGREGDTSVIGYCAELASLVCNSYECTCGFVYKGED